MLLVKVGQGICHLRDVPATLLLVESTKFRKLLVQFSLCGKLDDQEDTFRVVEVTIHSEDVWMTKILLNLNLATDLLLHSSCDNLLLVQTLESDNKVRCSLSARKVYPSELSFA